MPCFKTSCFLTFGGTINPSPLFYSLISCFYTGLVEQYIVLRSTDGLQATGLPSIFKIISFGEPNMVTK